MGVSPSLRPPTSVWDRVWAAGPERRRTKRSLLLPPISLSLTTCPPSASPSEHEGLGHLAGDFLGAQLSPLGCSLPLPATHDPLRAPSSGGAGVKPPFLLRFVKCLQIQKRFRNAFRLREPEDLG